jgi:hypothetical protein
MFRRLVAVFLALFVAGIVGAQEHNPRVLPDDLVINDSFEPDASFWTVKDADKDKVKCGGVGHISDCAFLFKGGAGEQTKVKQVYTPGVNPSGTQYIYFNANVRPVKGAASITFFVTVKFNGAVPALKEKYLYNAAVPALSYSAVEFDTDFFDPATVKKIVFGAKNNSLSGKVYVDAFTVGAFMNKR